MKGETGNCSNIKSKVCGDRISALPEKLLVKILLFLPTEDAMATAILSKRWRSVWKMLPKLDYYDPYDDEDGESDRSVWSFIDKSLLQLSKAPVIERLSVHLGPSCPVDADVGKLVDNVVNRGIQCLDFSLLLSTGPRSLSKSLYTCITLKKLSLSNKILVDVPFEASLPSLVHLELECVVYKDEDSLVRLLSSCPVLQNLYVNRNGYENDNLTNFIVKVPSLQLFEYTNFNDDGSLVMDSPGLRSLKIFDSSKDACLIEDMTLCLDMAEVKIGSHLNEKSLRSLSSVRYLNFSWINKTDPICFSRLIECKLTPLYPSENWVELVMHMLHNAPKLKVLMINSEDVEESEDSPLWSCVPECLSSHLEIFEWEKYKGNRDEKKLLTYILANSKCLKTVRVSLDYNVKEPQKTMMEELESMHRVSESSQLFFSDQFRWSSMKQHPAYQVMRF